MAVVAFTTVIAIKLATTVNNRNNIITISNSNTTTVTLNSDTSTKLLLKFVRDIIVEYDRKYC